VKRPMRWRRRWLLTGLVVAAAVFAGGLAAAWVAGLLFPDTARPASVEDALRQFRARDPHPAKLDGVYLYATQGEESLDVLGGARHPYPATTTVTVVEVPCGVRLDWSALEGRSTTWTLCTTARADELQQLEEVHSFFGSTDQTLYSCTGTVLRPAQAAIGETSPLRCRSQHDTQEGQVRVVGRTQVDVGGVSVNAFRIRTTAHVTGGDRGTETVDWWLGARGELPLELVVSSETSRPVPVIGRAHYRERATLRLVSTTPLR